LREFERGGHLDADPYAVIECMAEENIGRLEVVLELAGRVVNWLCELEKEAKSCPAEGSELVTTVVPKIDERTSPMPCRC
jgi:hypothetical protein